MKPRPEGKRPYNKKVKGPEGEQTNPQKAKKQKRQANAPGQEDYVAISKVALIVQQSCLISL